MLFEFNNDEKFTDTYKHMLHIGLLMGPPVTYIFPDASTSGWKEVEVASAQFGATFTLTLSKLANELELDCTSCHPKNLLYKQYMYKFQLWHERKVQFVNCLTLVMQSCDYSTLPAKKKMKKDESHTSAHRRNKRAQNDAFFLRIIFTWCSLWCSAFFVALCKYMYKRQWDVSLYPIK